MHMIAVGKTEKFRATERYIALEQLQEDSLFNLWIFLAINTLILHHPLIQHFEMTSRGHFRAG